MAEDLRRDRLSLGLLVTDADMGSGGVQGLSHRLLREFSQRGHSAFMCCRNYRHLPRNEVRDGYLIHRSPATRRLFRVFNSILYWVDGLAWLIRHRREFDVLLCQQLSGASILGLIAKALLGKPVVVRGTSTGERGEIQEVRRMAFSSVRLRLLRRVDHWVALTRVMRDEILALGVAPERITVIPNATHLPDEVEMGPGVLRRRAELRLCHRKVAVFTGRLSSEKGLDTLLHAWALLGRDHPDVHLLILGEGGAYRNVEADLLALRERLGLEPVVHFLGHVPNVVDYLLASDLFVLPTRFEGMSNSLVEAMAAGMAIVTTDIPANREVIDDGVEGLLVSPDDPHALAAAIGRVLGEPGLGQRLGAAARRRAEEVHSIGNVVDRYLDVLRGVIP